MTSLLAGVTVFSVLGNLAFELDTDIRDVVRGGSGLAFISYPDAIAKFDWAQQVRQTKYSIKKSNHIIAVI